MKEVSRRGIVILQDEVSETWLDWMTEAGLNVLGIHGLPDGNGRINEEAFLKWVQNEENRSLVRRFEEAGITVEYELHTAEWLVPRSEFGAHPDWFRMEKNGRRVRDYNFCPSSLEAMAVAGENAYHLASVLRQTSHNYYFWLDDRTDTICHCERCRTLSGADQNMLVMNEILKGIRNYDPEAKLAYLAYGTALEVPSVKPAEEIFLEFAPMHRDHAKPLDDTGDARNAMYAKLLRELGGVFDLSQAHVLEYWLDNALFSDYQKPPVKVPFEAEVMRADVAFYQGLGIDFITTFGAFLGDDYVALYGKPPITKYGSILINPKNNDI